MAKEKDGEKDEKTADEIFKLITIDPVQTQQLYNNANQDNLPPDIYDTDIRTTSEDVVNLAKYIMKTITDQFKQYDIKYSVTPSSIDEAFKRLLTSAVNNYMALNSSIMTYYQANIRKAIREKNVNDVLMYMEKMKKIIIAILMSIHMTINEIMGIIGINLPLEITSQLYKHTVLGIDHIEAK